MKKKIENFLYYYKFHMIAVAFIILIIVVLLRDKGRNEVDFAIVDHTSQLDMTTAESLLEDFREYSGLKEDEAGFYYRSMYLEEESFQDVSFSVAGINDYEKCFTNGNIDVVITTANDLCSETTSFTEILAEEDLEKYKDYIYYDQEQPVGIIFDRCAKAEEYFGDNYPTDYHYIVQVAKGSVNDKNVEKFIKYLLEE